MPAAIVATLAIILPGYVMIPLLSGFEHLRLGIDLFGNKNVADSKPWQRIQSFILSNHQAIIEQEEKKLCRQQLSRMAKAPDSNSLTLLPKQQKAKCWQMI